MRWIALCAALFIALTAPGMRRARVRRWRGVCFAHRGLHGPGRAENSLAAFEAACRAGYGVELDVRLSRDGQPVVFHDGTLERLCGDSRRPEELTVGQLKALSLRPTGDSIPTLDEALTCLAGRVPLLVEIKSSRRLFRLTGAVCARLQAYPGDYLVQSFHPLCLWRLRWTAPGMARGQLLASRGGRSGSAFWAVGSALAGLTVNALSRPDFVSYDISDACNPAPHLQRALYATPMAAWTVRTREELALARSRGEMVIFEGIRP